MCDAVNHLQTVRDRGEEVSVLQLLMEFKSHLKDVAILDVESSKY